MKYLLLFICLSLSACHQLEDALYDCIDNDGPEFETDSLPIGVLSQTYYATITVAIDNEPFDDAYDYYFDIHSNLPSGLHIEQHGRRLIISGIPNQAGIFNLDLWVEVSGDNYNFNIDREDDYDDGNDLCYVTASRQYKLEIIDN